MSTVLVLTCIVLLGGCGMNMRGTSGTNLSQQVAPDVPDAPGPGMTIVSGGKATPTVDADYVPEFVEPTVSPTWEEIRDRVAQKDPGWVGYIDSLKGVHIQGWTGSIVQIYYHRDKDGVEVMSIDMDGPNDSAGRFYDAHVVLLFINSTETRPWEVGQQITIEGKILKAMYDGEIYIEDPNIALDFSNN